MWSSRWRNREKLPSRQSVKSDCRWLQSPEAGLQKSESTAPTFTGYHTCNGLQWIAQISRNPVIALKLSHLHWTGSLSYKQSVDGSNPPGGVRCASGIQRFTGSHFGNNFLFSLQDSRRSFNDALSGDVIVLLSGFFDERTIINSRTSQRPWHLQTVALCRHAGPGRACGDWAAVKLRGGSWE